MLFSSVTYLRLDGSVAPEKRFDIVKAFNSDPTIDALLLTTHGKNYWLQHTRLVLWISLIVAISSCSWWTWFEPNIS